MGEARRKQDSGPAVLEALWHNDQPWGLCVRWERDSEPWPGFVYGTSETLAITLNEILPVSDHLLAQAEARITRLRDAYNEIFWGARERKPENQRVVPLTRDVLDLMWDTMITIGVLAYHKRIPIDLYNGIHQHAQAQPAQIEMVRIGVNIPHLGT